MVAEPDSEGSF